MSVGGVDTAELSIDQVSIVWCSVVCVVWCSEWWCSVVWFSVVWCSVESGGVL